MTRSTLVATSAGSLAFVVALLLAACAGSPTGAGPIPRVPEAPGDVVATAGEGSMTLTFVVDDGGSPVTALEYRLGSSDWTPAATATSPLTLTGLTPGVLTTVTLRATNAVGTGVASSPVSAIPWFAPFAIRGGGAASDTARRISTLGDGSARITGAFEGTATFGATTLESLGLRDVYVAAVGADGEWLWARRVGGEGFDGGRGISTFSDGSALVVGQFTGTATFGSTTLVSASGTSDGFVARIGANGTWLWAQLATGTLVEPAVVSVFDDGSAVVAGRFAVDATFGTTTLESVMDSPDVFVAKISANGNWLWAQHAGGSGLEGAPGIATFGDGSAIVTGWFEPPAQFGSTTLISSASQDVYVAKISADGVWQWAQRAGGSASFSGQDVTSLADGSSIVTGYFRGTATFGTTELESQGEAMDVFVAKVSASGTWLWAQRAGGTGWDYGWGLSALGDGGALVVGQFEGFATFGATTIESMTGSTDVFVARIGPSGDWLWSQRAGGTGRDTGTSISALSDGSALVTGEFAGAASFGAATLDSASGSQDVFVARIRPDGAW